MARVPVSAFLPPGLAITGPAERREAFRAAPGVAYHERVSRVLATLPLAALSIACSAEVVVPTGTGGGTTTASPPKPSPPAIVSVAKVTKAGGAQSEYFGECLDISGDTTIVGSRFMDDGIVVRRIDGVWAQEAELVTTDEHNGIDAVAIDGDVVVMASTNRAGTDLAGAAYVFRRFERGWAYEAMLVAEETVWADLFGHSVAVSGDTIAVGAKGNLDGRSGAVYVFTRTGAQWERQAKLVGHHGIADDELGFRVALAGDTIAASAPGLIGSAVAAMPYVFVRTGSQWQEDRGLPRREWDTLSVSLSDHTLFAGSNFEQGGLVLVRDETRWQEEAELIEEHPSHPGYSVGIAATFAVIGSTGDSLSGTAGDGRAYAFARRDGLWSSSTLLVPEDDEFTAQFGNPVAVSGNTAVVADPYDWTNAKHSGAIYFFELAAPP